MRFEISRDLGDGPDVDIQYAQLACHPHGLDRPPTGAIEVAMNCGKLSEVVPIDEMIEVIFGNEMIVFPPLLSWPWLPRRVTDTEAQQAFPSQVRPKELVNERSLSGPGWSTVRFPGGPALGRVPLGGT